MSLLNNLFPGWALKRHSQKMALDRLLEHDKTHRRHPSRRMGPQSGDAVIDQARAKTRESARWLTENNGIAVSIIESLITGIVGDGTKVEPMVKTPDGKLAKETNKQLRKAYQDFMMAPEVTGQLCGCDFEAMLIRSWLRDGEIFGQHVRGSGSFNYKSDIQYAVELIEADMVPFSDLQNQDEYTHGVRRNAWGQPTGYLVYLEHPGNSFGQLKSNFGKVKAVPAENMFHVKLTDRIGQARGVSLFHAVIDTLLDLDHYEDAERTAARVAACQTMVIKSDMGSEIEADGEYKMAPNAVWQLRPGEDAQMFSPDRPNRNLDPFVMSQIRRACAGAFASASTVSRNYLGNYSSQRQELIDQYRVVKRLRKIYYQSALNDIYRYAIAAALKSKSRKIDITGIDDSTLFDVDFRGPAMPWIDPQKEAAAAEKHIEIGVKSREQFIRENGDDPETVTEELLNDEFTKSQEAKEKKLAEANRPTEPSDDQGPDDEQPTSATSKVRSIS